MSLSMPEKSTRSGGGSSAATPCAWPYMSAIVAPPNAKFSAWPRAAGFFATRRRYTLSTAGFVPVAHEFVLVSAPS